MEAKNMEAVAENHEQRIGTLEKQYSEVMTKINDVDKTVREEGREQRNLIQTLLNHTLGMQKQKDNNRTKIVVAALGGGGAVGAIGGLIALITKLI